MEPPRRRKRVLVRVAIAASLLVAYVGSYVALSAAGEYRVSATGKLRIAGMAVPDVDHWQPAFAEWEPFRDVSGNDTSRGDLLGHLYAPLIRIDRAWRHPSRYLSDEMKAATRPAS